MAETEKYLSTAGVGRLWKNVTKKVATSVEQERIRAQQEEARLEQKINEKQTNYLEGDGIDISINENGQKIIQLESNSINDSHIESISFSKLNLKEGDSLILHGGNANG